MTVVVDAQGLSKCYRLRRARYGTLREALSGVVRRLLKPRVPRTERGEVWALRGLDLAVDDGSALGIVGRNGAGKTTLLRILSGITEPSEGVARVRGRVGALLEVGTGFHPELTGRENVYLNAALLGLSRRETARRFDRIVQFAGVERFLNTQLKHYSAGMALRLAFAVAAHIEPDILLVDEVLAVGDAEFQRRCLSRVAELGRQGRTALVVSHDLGMVSRLCSRAVWLDSGTVCYDGSAAETVERYLAAELGRRTTRAERNDDNVQLAVSLLDVEAEPLDTPSRDEPFSIEIEFAPSRPLPSLDLAVYVTNEAGMRVIDEAWSDRAPTGASLPMTGRHVATLTLPPILRAGDYGLGVWIGNEYDDLFDGEVLSFTVQPRPEDRREHLTRSRLVQPQVRWQLGSRPASAERG